MGYVIQSSGGTLPQEAMRSIVEAVDTWRGQAAAFVVFQNKAPYEIDSVHRTLDEARAVADGDKGHGRPVRPAHVAGEQEAEERVAGGLHQAPVDLPAAR